MSGAKPSAIATWLPRDHLALGELDEPHMPGIGDRDPLAIGRHHRDGRVRGPAGTLKRVASRIRCAAMSTATTRP